MEAEDYIDYCVVGTCQLMCPVEEVQLRTSRDLLHYFELRTNNESRNEIKAVKEYSRPAAGKSDPKQPELRPASVLIETTHYLVTQILPRRDRPWHFVYEFVFGRLRAVRQDMTIQRLNNSDGVRLLECIIRVMIYAHYRLCTEPASRFDSKINSTHIQECLKRLLVLYERTSNCRCHMAEFVSLYLLFNLGSTDALKYGLERKQDLWNECPFSIAMRISLAWYNTNYVRVIRLARLLPVLHKCALQTAKPYILRCAMSIMSSGYHNKTLMYSLAEITNVLDLDDEKQAEMLCEMCGLDLSKNQSVRFWKQSFQSDVKIPPHLSNAIEDDLLWEDLSELLLGPKCLCLSSRDVT